MVKIPAKATNERREKVWFLMLKGCNPQSMSKVLNVSHVTIYNDIKFLTKKSKQYVFDLAKGTHVLMYQRAVEGISLTRPVCTLKSFMPLMVVLGDSSKIDAGASISLLRKLHY